VKRRVPEFDTNVHDLDASRVARPRVENGAELLGGDRNRDVRLDRGTVDGPRISGNSGGNIDR
jgi:hypothetical protein